MNIPSTKEGHSHQRYDNIKKPELRIFVVIRAQGCMRIQPQTCTAESQTLTQDNWHLTYKQQQNHNFNHDFEEVLVNDLNILWISCRSESS